MRQLHTQLRKFVHDRKGLAALEFALIAPFMLLLYFGVVDLANWYMMHRRLVLAGSTMADLTTQSAGTVTSADMAKYWTGVGDIIAPMTVSNVNLTMRNYRKDSNSARRQWTYSQGSSCSGNPSAEQLVAIATGEMTEGNDILIAEVCTTLSPIVLQVFGWNDIKLDYQIGMRPRLGKTLDCTAGCS